jgi:hypothetical protein
MTHPTTTSPHPYLRRWGTLGLLGVAQLMLILDVTVPASWSSMTPRWSSSTPTAAGEVGAWRSACCGTPRRSSASEVDAPPGWRSWAGNTRARRFYAKSGWHDRGPFTYPAQTATGMIPVPANRYEREVSDG